MQHLSRFLITCLVLFYSFSGQSNDWAAPVRGIMDLRNYEFNEQSYIKLNGEWEFYWESFISSDEFEAPVPPEPLLYGKVPSYWADYSNPNFSFPHTGFASYRLRILLPPGFDQDIGFDVPVFDAAFILFLNGEERSWSVLLHRLKRRREPDWD